MTRRQQADLAMNRKEREALCELLEHMSRLVNDPAQKTMVQAAAQIRRLAEALEQISRATAIDNEAALVARRALDGEDDD